MKVIIDLIEDLREAIGNEASYQVTVGLLKEDTNDPSRLIYTGEAPVNRFIVDHEKREVYFKIDGSNAVVTVGDLVPRLLILDMDAMMYGLKVDVNVQYSEVEVVGFGKNDEEKRYVLFIKL
jgi:hypothetical protein